MSPDSTHLLPSSFVGLISGVKAQIRSLRTALRATTRVLPKAHGPMGLALLAVALQLPSSRAPLLSSQLCVTYTLLTPQVSV